MSSRRKRFRRCLLIGLPLVFIVVAAAGVGMYLIRNEFVREFLAIGESWSDSDIRETKRRAEPIIAAIEAFREQNGRLPASLDDLAPDFLSAIESPTVGDGAWSYAIMRSEADHFNLVVFSRYRQSGLYNGPEAMWYDSMSRSWQVMRDDS